MSKQVNKIVVLGGGYAGIMAALRIAGKTKRLNTAVTLINALDYFVERPRLHEQATGTKLNGRSIADMLAGSGAHFVQGWVTQIVPDVREVIVKTADSMQTFSYNTLVVALGSRVNREPVPGVKDYAFTLDPYGELSTTELMTRLAELKGKPFRTVVVGGGATGIEAAAEIKAKHPQSDVTLVTQGEAASFKGPKIQKHMLQALAEQSIQVFEQKRVTAVTANSVVTTSQRFAADVIVWAGGFVASSLAKEAGVQVNGRYQIMTDPYLRSLSHPNIYAVGDMAFPVEEPGAPMRMSLFTALVSGAQAANNILAEFKGKQPQPLSFAWYGQGIALGPHDAVGFSTYPMDAPVGPVFRRKTAVKIRNFFVWFLKAALELERRFPGFLTWNGKKRYAQRRRSQPVKIVELN